MIDPDELDNQGIPLTCRAASDLCLTSRDA
jgi:hypothetical protein